MDFASFYGISVNFLLNKIHSHCLIKLFVSWMSFWLGKFHEFDSHAVNKPLVEEEQGTSEFESEIKWNMKPSYALRVISPRTLQNSVRVHWIFTLHRTRLACAPFERFKQYVQLAPLSPLLATFQFSFTRAWRCKTEDRVKHLYFVQIILWQNIPHIYVYYSFHRCSKKNSCFIHPFVQN